LITVSVSVRNLAKIIGSRLPLCTSIERVIPSKKRQYDNVIGVRSNDDAAAHKSSLTVSSAAFISQ
jgi:hypothetical protein